MNKLDLAWAGGLFEGEGSVFTVGKQCAGISLTMTDEDVVRKFSRVIGFGVIRPRKHKPNHKKPWEWRTTSFEHVQATIAMLWCFLGQRRKQKAKEILLKARNGKLHSKYRVAQVPTCHSDRPYCAKGMCRPCYAYKWLHNNNPQELGDTPEVPIEPELDPETTPSYRYFRTPQPTD